MIVCVLGSLGCANGSRADGLDGALDDLLALVPSDATSVIAIPSLAKVSGDIDACIAGMDRKETVIAGRPVDQLRGALDIREGFDEKGSMAVWTTTAQGDAAGVAGVRPVVLLIPCDDPAAFLLANLTPDAAGVGTFRGESVYSKALAKHVIVSRDRAAIDGYDAKGGILASLKSRLGERGMALARGGDLFAWGTGATLREMLSKGAVEAPGMIKGIGARGDSMRALLDGVADGLLVADADPLGLSLRGYASFAAESELAKLATGAKPLDGDAGATLAGLPKAPFYLALAVDTQSLGGAAAADALIKSLGAADLLPTWFSQAKDGVRSIRFAAYPSKLGLLAGGLFNDSALLIETTQPQVMRDLFKSSLLSQAGVGDGVRREPAWEEARTLKDGSEVDAYELKETPLGPSEADGADLGQVAMQQMIRQASFGSRGMHGFVKVLPSAVIVTFSQRPDVLSRALAAASGGESLKDDTVLASMRPFMVRGAQVEGFISVGQILKVVRQLAQTFGGAGLQLPTIPSKSPPIALGFRVSPTAAEGAVMIPTATLAAVYDQMMRGAMGGGRAKDDAPQTPAPQPDPSEPAKE